MSPLRSRLLAAAVLVGQLFLLAAQAPDQGDRGSTGEQRSLLAGAALRAVAPLAGGVARAGDAVAAIADAWKSRSALRTENARLRDELRDLRRDRLRLIELELESAELARGLSYARESGLSLRAAEVVYLDRRSWLRSLVLRVGGSSARIDQVVLAEHGIVGRVVEASGPWAKVQLVTDRAAAVGVLLEGARRQGVVRGAGPDELVLELIPRQVEVTAGDRLLTAGIDGVYPRGLPVGVVTAVEPGDELFHHIRVRPLVDFAELGIVYLLDVPPRTRTLAPGEPGAGG